MTKSKFNQNDMVQFEIDGEKCVGWIDCAVSDDGGEFVVSVGHDGIFTVLPYERLTKIDDNPE